MLLCAQQSLLRNTGACRCCCCSLASSSVIIIYINQLKSVANACRICAPQGAVCVRVCLETATPTTTTTTTCKVKSVDRNVTVRLVANCRTTDVCVQVARHKHEGQGGLTAARYCWSCIIISRTSVAPHKHINMHPAIPVLFLCRTSWW